MPGFDGGGGPLSVAGRYRWRADVGGRAFTVVVNSRRWRIDAGGELMRVAL